MLWRLETRNAECTDAALAAAGASQAERSSPAAVAATDHMPPEQAIEALAQAVRRFRGLQQGLGFRVSTS